MTCLSSTFVRLTAYISALLLLVVAAGCDLLEDSGPNGSEPITGSVFIANQGNFGDGDGSVSVYNPQTQEVAAFAIDDLGTIIQSIALFNDRLYIMGNTAERVDVYSVDGLSALAQIDDVDSPRYAAQVANDRAYVTGLGDFAGEQGTVTAIDLTTNEVMTEIEVGGNPEGIAYVNGRAFVATGGFAVSDSVAIVDVATNTLLDKVSADCPTPRHVFARSDTEVLVVCTGHIVYDENFNPVEELPGALRILDATGGTILARLDLEERLATAGSGQDAYYVPETGQLFAARSDNAVLRIDTSLLKVEEVLGPFDGDPIGAVAYDVLQERLYLGRVPGFDQNGTVTVHEADGTDVHAFDAGVAPSHVVFRYEVE